ncbi:carbohydrate ABC transporter permease [Pseudonocardia adelaidensis]|uniref:Sugar ABC transporter permease n=1 Tax=Pseudonocardia adelaidensis TaxID=648754 RepID=A0ABP9NK74_9PSEU
MAVASPSRRRGLTGFLFFAPFLLVFLVAIVAPLLYALGLSLFRRRLIGGTSFVGLDNYLRAAVDPQFLAGVGRVALFLIFQVPVMLLLALFVALAIDGRRVWWPKLFRLGVFVPYAVPAVVGTLMWGFLYGGQFGLTGQIADAFGVDPPDFFGTTLMLPALANIVTWQFVGYNMLILYAALRAIPQDLYDAAEVDGAGEFRKVWSVKLPALRPALLLATIFSVIGSFQLFTEPKVMQDLAPAVITTSYTPNIYAYELAFNGQLVDYSAAISVLLGLVTIVVAYVVQLTTARRERIL